MKQIPVEVLSVLDNLKIRGAQVVIAAQLERKLYLQVNDVFGALGGEWSRKQQAHVFQSDPLPLIEAAILTGSYAPPTDFDFFETPAAVVARMLDMADMTSRSRVLEPSAGHGAIVRALLGLTPDVQAYELVPARAKRVASFGVPCKAIDFMGVGPDQKYERVVMNPPFSRQQDIEHVLHAYMFLALGGKLVSVMSSGVTFRDTLKTKRFREFVDAKHGRIEQLPPASFHESGTNVNAVFVCLER